MKTQLSKLDKNFLGFIFTFTSIIYLGTLSVIELKLWLGEIIIFKADWLTYGDYLLLILITSFMITQMIHYFKEMMKTL